MTTRDKLLELQKELAQMANEERKLQYFTEAAICKFAAKSIDDILTADKQEKDLLLMRCYDALHSATYWAGSALRQEIVEPLNYNGFVEECKSIAREINEVLAEGK
jgi:hypothetical protein